MGKKKYFFRQVGKWLILIFLFGIFLFSARAEAGYFSDDFESALGNWVVSGQDWDLTTSASRSATHSLTDSPSGNYISNEDARATLVHSIDLTTSTSPVLTFWHKYDLPDYYGLSSDHAYVEISTDGGSTWTELGSWSSDISTTWALEQIDLSNYKTSQIKIRFRLDADGDDYVGDGWYIDDVQIKEQEKEKESVTSLNVFIRLTGGGTVTGEGINCPGDCLETYQYNWIVSGQDWDLTTSASRSATHSLTDSPSGNYIPNEDARATLAHSIDLTTSTSPVLTFWHKYDLPDYYGLSSDHAYVEISTDGGSTWTELGSWSSDISTTWALEQIPLSNYKTSQIKIRFRLDADGDDYVGDGWYIDDVQIKEQSGSISYFFDNFEGENSLSNWIVKKGGVDLTATPNPGFTFKSWFGCDTQEGNQCTVNIDVIDRIVTATFLPIRGDINADGKIDISDVILTLRCALGLDLCNSCADMNGDGQVDISDVILVLRCALELDICNQPCAL